jgi:uncharacterized membrane-anchored protein
MDPLTLMAAIAGGAFLVSRMTAQPAQPQVNIPSELEQYIQLIEDIGEVAVDVLDDWGLVEGESAAEQNQQRRDAMAKWYDVLYERRQEYVDMIWAGMNPKEVYGQIDVDLPFSATAGDTVSGFQAPSSLFTAPEAFTLNPNSPALQGRGYQWFIDLIAGEEAKYWEAQRATGIPVKVPSPDAKVVEWR